MKIYRFHFLFAACFGVGAILLYLLLFSHYPPTSPAVLRILQDTFAYINIIPLELSAHSQNYVHAKFAACLFFVGIFFQWFAVGYGLSFLFRRLRGHDGAA